MDFSPDDCADALIVTFSGILQGEGGPLPGTSIKCAVPLSATFTVALIRCVPALADNAAGPTPEALTASAEEVLVDAMTLAKVIVDIYLDEGPCNLKAIGAVTPIGPQGAAGGNTVQVLTELS